MKYLFGKEFDFQANGIDGFDGSIALCESADDALEQIIREAVSSSGGELIGGGPVTEDIHISATPAIVYVYDIGCCKKVCVGLVKEEA